MSGEGLALGVVGALALAAVAASRLSKARGSANLSAARREAFDALAEAYRSYARKVSAFSGTLESRNFAKSNGINFLGDGSFRAVFSVPEGALKIQKRRYQNEEGWPEFGENEKEVQIWQSAPAGIRKSLVPILDHAHDYSWVLMPEVEMGGTLDPEKIKGLSACGIGDLRAQNISRDGRIVDYSIIESAQALADCLARGRAQRSASGSAARSRGIKIEPVDNKVRAGTLRPSRVKGSPNLSAARREAFDALAEAYRDYASQFDFASILDIHRFARANGLTFLGDGWSRAVFSVPEGALKIAKSRQMSLGGQSPFAENQKEVEIYQSAPASIARHLVPILDHAHDYAWVLMPKVEIGGTLGEEAIKALSACGVGDFTTRNTSRDGQIVDYAAILSTQALAECLTRGRAQRSASGSAARSRRIEVEPAGNLSAARRNAFDVLADAYRGYARKVGRGQRNPTADENQRFGRSKRMKFLGSGWSRAVFRVPEGALKIELGWAPFTENQSEAQIWDASPRALAPHLVPVLDHAHDYSWILMPEVEVGGTISPAAADALNDCGITDFHGRRDNVSTDGQLVDYSFIFDSNKLAACLTRGRAQRSASGSAARSRGSREISHGKAWAELREDLSEIGHGVLGEQIVSTTLKTCSSTAPAVMQYLLERGHVVAPGGQGRPSGYTHHYDLAVLTSDRGWLNVDPTFMQFHCKHQPSEDEGGGEDWSDLAELRRHLRAAWVDPMATYRIDPLPWPATPRGEVEVKAPPMLSKVSSWADYWEKYKRLATSAVDKARRQAAGENVGRFKVLPYASLIAS